MTNVKVEASWLRQLLDELHSPLAHATLAYYDNVSAVYLSTNSVDHQRTKHVQIDMYFVRERVVVGDVRVLSVPPRCSSPISSLRRYYREFRFSLNICIG